MKKTNKFLSLGMALTLATGLLAGCSASSSSSAAPSVAGSSSASAAGTSSVAGEPLKIEVVSKGFQVDFWKMVNKGCMQAGEEYNAVVNFVGPASEANISEQIEQLNNAINKKPDAICFAPLDQEASMDLIQQAGNAGIPMITFDANIEADTNGAVLAFVATDNIAAGAEAAQRMYDEIKEKVTSPAETVRIAVMAQDTTSKSVEQRTRGFIEKMVELCGAENTSVEGHDMYAKKVEGASIIIDVGIPPETTDAAGNTTAQTLLNKDNVVGIYGSNEFSAKAIVNVNESMQVLGPDKICAIGFDSGAIQVQAVRDQVLFGSITQDPIQIGYTVVKTAAMAARGEEVKDVSVPFHFYDSSNIDDPEIASCLYE